MVINNNIILTKISINWNRIFLMQLPSNQNTKLALKEKKNSTLTWPFIFVYKVGVKQKKTKSYNVLGDDD
jgi:hypothetical protein